MAPLKFMLVAVTAGVASAFSPSTFGVRKDTQLHESFGFGFAEDTYENQPDLLKGEAEYKQYMNRVKGDNMLNRKVSVEKLVPYLHWEDQRIFVAHLHFLP
jgi:hypothetical protein